MINKEELEKYMARSELDHLSVEEKNTIRAFIDQNSDYPTGRVLALALMTYNDICRHDRVSQPFINWLYTY